MKAISALILLTLSILGLTSCAQETVQAPKAVATIAHETGDLANEDTSDPVPAPAPVSQPLTWAQATLAKYGVTLPSGAVIALTNVANCGADLSPLHVGGCTYPATASTPITIVISPEFEGTQWGEYILLHEASHALGNWTDECAADQFARDLTGMDYWAYDEQCNPEYVAPATAATPQQATAALDADRATAATTATTTAPQIAAQPQPAPTQTVEPQTTTAQATQPTPPAPPVPSIPPYTDEACSEFEARAEDGSCVPSNYWDEGPDMGLDPVSPPVIIPPHAEPNPGLDCDNLQLGDAHAGIGLACGLDPADPTR